MGSCVTKLQKDNKPNTQIKYQYTWPKQKFAEQLDDTDYEDKEEEVGKSKVNHTPIEAKAVLEAHQDVNQAPHLRTKTSKFPSRHVVIVGAGPAGIHMATLLIKQGYTSSQITILEKTGRSAGKSYTVQDVDNGDSKAQNDYEGQPIVHELGTCYLHPEYHGIMQLLEEYDPDNLQVGIPSRSVYGTSLNEAHEKKNPDDKIHTVSYSEYAMGKAKELSKSLPKAFDKLPQMITSGFQFEDAITKYIKLHQKIFGKQSSVISYLSDRVTKNHPIRRFPGQPSEADLKELDCTFEEWLTKKELRALIPFFVYSQSAQGYGILDKIPAFYGLFWNTPELMRTVADLFRIGVDEPNVIVLTKGYEHLWQMMIEKEQLNIVYNCNITKIDRHLSEDKANRPHTEVFYTVESNAQGDQKEAEKKEQVIEADVLFLACGCKKALDSFWTDATEEEKEVFDVLAPHTLCATLFEYDVNPELETHQTVVDIWPNIIWKANGHIYAYRNSIKCLLGHDKYDRLVKEGKLKKDRGIAYQFLNRAPEEADADILRTQLVNNLEAWGEKNVAVLRQECWDYMPMWENPAILKGYPWRVKDEMQGKYGNTFYIGSSVCFESVINVVEYNFEICNLYTFDNDSSVFFCKKRIGDHGPFQSE